MRFMKSKLFTLYVHRFRFCWFLQKNADVRKVFWGDSRWFLSVFWNMSVKSHTKFEDSTTFCSDIKTEKRNFQSPMNFTEKRLTYKKKNTGKCFMHLFQSKYIRESYWLKFKKKHSHVLPWLSHTPYSGTRL